MSKRKRSVSNNVPQPVVIQFNAAEETPSLGMKAGLRSRPQTRQEVATTSANTNTTEEASFRVPGPPKVRKRSGSNPGASRRKQSNGVQEQAMIATPEQERQTQSCRQMRRALIQVISDVHRDLKNRQKPDGSELVENLRICWKKYPVLFASAPKVPKSPADLVDDLSQPSEIKDFLPWWLHGLTSLLLCNDLKAFRNDLKDILKTFAQFLTYGNPNLVEVCFVQLLEVLNDFLSKESVEIKLEFQDEDGNSSQLDVHYQILKNDDTAICEFLDVVRAFLPRIFQFQVIHKQKLLLVLRKLWMKLSDNCKFKFLSTFLVPVIPLVHCSLFPTENLAVKFLEDIISSGVNSKLSCQNVSRFLSFCNFMSTSVVPMSVFPQSLLLQLHSCLSKVIVGQQFNRCATETQREGIIQLYVSLTGQRSKVYEKQRIKETDVKKFLKTSQTPPAIENSHPLLEDSIVDDLKKAFLNIDGELPSNVANGGSSAKIRDRKPMSINSRTVSQPWGKILLDLDVALTSVRDDTELAISTLKKSYLTFRMAANVNRRVMQFAAAFNRESKSSVLWVPDFQLLNANQLELWTKFAGRCLTRIFSGSGFEKYVNEVTTLVLDTMRAFDKGNFMSLKVGLTDCSDWLAMAAVPWYPLFKSFVHPKKFSRDSLLSTVKPSALKAMSSSTKAKCLRALAIETFLPFKEYILEIFVKSMGTFGERPIVCVVLELFKEFSWVIRNIPWNALVAYLHRVMTAFQWRAADAKMRNLVTEAIVLLPCYYSNQQQRNCAGLTPSVKIKLDVNECGFCKKDSSTMKIDSLTRMTEDKLTLMLRLLLPLAKSHFLVAKLELCKLITSVRNHTQCNEYSQDLISVFGSMAALGHVSVGFEVMERMDFYLRKPQVQPQNEVSSSDESLVERRDAIDLLFNVLRKFFDDSFAKNKSMRFSIKVLIILQELAANVDQLMTVAIIKFVLRLLVCRDSNVINMLSQYLVGLLASKVNCSAWELMNRLRYELAEEILSLAKAECLSRLEDSDLESEMERCRVFFSSICTVGEYRTALAFIHSYYPILLGYIVPTLFEIMENELMFKGMSEFASLPPSQILQDGFHNYYRALVLGHSSDTVNKCFAYLKSKYGLDHNFVASNVVQGTLNEMLCHLDERKERVLKFIPQLLQRNTGPGSSRAAAKAVARSEIQELLSKNLMGFFVFVDTKLHSRLESVSTKRRILRSFIALIELIGKNRMTANRSKIYATLNSLFSLGTDFHDLLYEAWRTFSFNLENSAFGQMSVQILAAVLILKKTLPVQVDNLISHFILAKKELTEQYHYELYFLLDNTSDENVKKIISDSINRLRSESWGNYFELLVKESRHENSHIRYRAIKKLHDVLIEEHEYVQKMILEREHPVVSKILNSFLSASRDADNEILMLLAESFGALGAVDPYRFKDSEYEEIKRKTTLTFTVDGANFAAKYLDLLIREFQEAEDTTDFDYCACLIQQVLKHYAVVPLESDLVWHTMSHSVRELVYPLLTSKYKVEKELPKPDMSCPIYLSDNGKTFDQWLSNWLNLMITYIDEGSPALQLFQFSKYMIPRNNRIASFLLPYVATYAVIGGTRRQKGEIVKEIENILQRWIDQDVLKVNSQMLVPSKETQSDNGTPEPEVKLLCDEDVFQYRCTQEVFSVFDHLFRGLRQARRQTGLMKANQANKSRSTDPISPSLTEADADTIGMLLSQVHMQTVSQVAFHCEDYKRALFYVEQDLKKNPHKLHDSLNYLQQLYVSLNDMDSVIGVATIRDREPTMSEVVLENIAKGKMEAAVRSLECMVSCDPDDLIANNGLLQAYLSVDEPRKAETLINGCISRNPHWEVALHEAQMETTWKLRNWSSLETQIKEVVSMSNPLVDTNPSWNMTIVKALSAIRTSDLETASKVVNESKVKLMSPLVAAANDNNAYSRGYSNVVQLHILTEVEQIVNLLKENFQFGFGVEDNIKSVISRWDSRLNVLLKSQKFIDPVLNVRKTLLEKVKESLGVEGPTLAILDGSIRDCWLTVARVESKAGNFTRAHNCLVEAKKYMSAKVMIEHAKLLSRKGEKEQAIHVLQTGLINYFPQLEDWKKKPPNASNGNVYTEEHKLCSKALLLRAKLCDEQHLFDFEENIKNYKSSTEVFKESEKNFFTLGGYYDRIWSNSEDKFKQSDVQALVVRYYAMSLHYGCKYVYQSLPRLLSIWFDFAAIGYNNGSGNLPLGTGVGSESQPEDWSGAVCQMHTTIRKLIKEIPAYVLLTAFSQLISRLCHGNVTVWDLLREIVGSIICTHPHQALWMTMAVSKSSYEMRKSRCVQIYKSVEMKKKGLKNTIEDYTVLADKLIELCVKDVDKSIMKASLDKVCKTLPKLLQNPQFGDVLIPFQVFLSPSLPPKGAGHKGYDAFPQKFVFIQSVEDAVDIMHSLVRPKKITLIGSNGKRYGILCKAKDDLRKDCKVMEVNNVINWYLHRNPDSRQRQLHVRIYAVTPLNEEHGLLEWVPNLSGLRGNLLSIYRDRGMTFNMRDFRNLIRSHDALSVKRQKYLTRFIEPYPPVLSEWFLNNFNDPQSWYKSRMSYIRTAAVMSVVGFVLGLGDRHGENILLDSSTGDIVHVDFNCLFNKGEGFDYPERVPFRLTHNMVEGMGPLGVEGVFRRSCEITMSMIREHKSIFLSVLRPFVYDPLVEWESGAKSFNSTGEVSNVKAVEHMKHIRNRINGSARNFTKEVNTELSVEAQVAYLIDEARSVDNLCRMYIGWAAFL